jgi:hypothetical protein
MSRSVALLVFVVSLGSCGCGSEKLPAGTAPLTLEQMQAIRADDKKIDDAERSGSGTATVRRKK